MGLKDLPRPALAGDVAVVAGAPDAARVLLIRRGNDPHAGRWALPGGFVDERERCEAAARRELFEETGVKVGEVDLLGIYDKPDRDPRGWVVSATYVTRIDAPVPATAADDAAEARWFALDGLPRLAFDHDEVLADVAAWHAAGT
jgi:8-oxo-dGTP diphosphatase